MTHSRRLVALAALCWGVTAVGATPDALSTCRAVSSPALRPIVELYTSQGCSSCPPADNWLSRLPVNAESGPIPLALHVGYWDYIGWKDPFARQAFNDRQVELSNHAANGSGKRGVYTPEVFVNGRETSKWYDPSVFVPTLSAQAAKATIEVDAGFDPKSTGKDERVMATVRWNAPQSTGTPNLYVAIKRSGFSTSVKAGENRGETLKNQHVVRAWSGPHAGRANEVKLNLPLPADGDASGTTLVAFVEDGSTGALLQAVALPLDRCVAPLTDNGAVRVAAR